MSKIEFGTIARHRDGRSGYVSFVSGNHETVDRIWIRENQSGPVIFDGSPDLAERQGWSLNVTADALRDHIATLLGEKEALNKAALADRSALIDFKGKVVDAMKDAVGDGTILRDGANSILAALDLDPLEPLWTVSVTTAEGTLIATIADVEADNAADACDKVNEKFGVTAEIRSVVYTFDYDGEGTASFERSQVVDSTPEGNETLADEYHDNVLSFDAVEQ